VKVGDLLIVTNKNNTCGMRMLTGEVVTIVKIDNDNVEYKYNFTADLNGITFERSVDSFKEVTVALTPLVEALL
jgi:hypothetical protein